MPTSYGNRKHYKTIHSWNPLHNTTTIPVFQGITQPTEVKAIYCCNLLMQQPNTFFPGKTARCISNQVSDLLQEAVPCLFHSPSFPIYALPQPSSRHAYNPLLSNLCLGVCLVFILTPKDFKQHFPQQERIPTQTDVLQCLMTGANHTSSQMKIWEHSSHPPLPQAAQAGAAPTCTHSHFPHSSTCDEQLWW